MERYVEQQYYIAGRTSGNRDGLEDPLKLNCYAAPTFTWSGHASIREYEGRLASVDSAVLSIWRHVAPDQRL